MQNDLLNNRRITKILNKKKMAYISGAFKFPNYGNNIIEKLIFR